MFKIFKSHPKLNWHFIESIEDLNKAVETSGTIALFKHSTRCSISSMAKNRLEKNWESNLDHIPIYYLDLIKHRNISNYIAETFMVRHQSPQIILLKDKKAIYDASHMSISVSDIANYI